MKSKEYFTLERSSFEVTKPLFRRLGGAKLELRLNRLDNEYQVEFEIENVARGILRSFPLREELSLINASGLYGLAGRLIREGEYKIRKYKDYFTFRLINRFGTNWEDYYKTINLKLVRQ